jgi:hypothetical protein
MAAAAAVNPVVTFNKKLSCTALCTAVVKPLVDTLYRYEFSKSVKITWKLLTAGLNRQLRVTAGVKESDVKMLAKFNGLLRQYVTVKKVRGGKRKIMKTFCLRRVLAAVATGLELKEKFDIDSLDCRFCLGGECRSDEKVTIEVAFMLVRILSSLDTLAGAECEKRYYALPKNVGDATSGSASGSDGGGQGDAVSRGEKNRFPLNALMKAIKAQDVAVAHQMSKTHPVSSEGSCDCDGSSAQCQCRR